MIRLLPILACFAANLLPARVAPALPTPAAPQLAAGVAAQGKQTTLSFAELDEVLLWRHARGEEGRAALRQLLELRVVERIQEEQKLEIRREQLEARWEQLDLETKTSGIPGGLRQYLAEQGIDRATFREYLTLSLATEILARRALGIRDKDPITSEQQNVWLEEEIRGRGYAEQPFPWSDGIVARCGDVTLRRSEYSKQLRQQLAPDTVTTAAYEALLEKRLLERFPDLSEAGLEKAVGEEIERRKREAEANPRYRGVPFSELLGAQGLSLESLARDPAIRAKTLANLAISRAHEEADLRAIYGDEREFFDGRYGEAVELFVIVLKAGRFKNELVRRTFDEASATLTRWRAEIDDLAEFQRMAAERSEEPASREMGGRLGLVARGEEKLPPEIKRAVFEAVDSTEGSLNGKLLGPIQIKGASALLCLGERRPAPPWNVMIDNVRSELQKRLFLETLQPSEVVLWNTAQ